MPWSVSIHAESTVVTGVFEMRPVLEGSGRDADPRQRQTAGSVCLSDKNDCSSRTVGLHRSSAVMSILPKTNWLAVLLA